MRKMFFLFTCLFEISSLIILTTLSGEAIDLIPFNMHIQEFSIPSFCSYNARYETLKNNRDEKKIFIETGTAGGEGIVIATLAGFEQMHSIELDVERYEISRYHIGKNPNVRLYLGDSTSVLPKILPSIHEPVVFWLDAHFNGDQPIGMNCPILSELKIISSHPIKSHTIIVDDMRCFASLEYDGITVDQVVAAIKEINSSYDISFQDGYIPGDVLVAKIDK